MRRVLAALCVVAVAVVAASVAQADQIWVTNWNNGGGNYVPGTQFMNPNATTDGAMWKKVGASAPAFLAETFWLDVWENSNSGWVSISKVSTDGAAYPGYFNNNDAPALPDGNLGTARQFILKAWLGSYSTYEAAYAAGEYCGITPVFTNPVNGFMMPLSYGFDKMPALILAQPVPEPATFVLLGAGLLGLLAYAWRKRR